MLQYVFDQDAFYTQCRAVYSQYPTDMSAVEAALDRRKAANPNASPFQMKVWIYEQAVHNCTVHLFPACPFFGELDTGRLRNSTTSTFPPQPGLGCWLMKQYPDFIQQYAQWSDHYTAYGVLNGPQFTDASHHYANVETVLQLGLQGIVEKILHRLGDSSLTAHQRDYLTALHAVCIHTIAIAQRFSDEAQRLLETETNPAYRSNLQRIAQTARQVPKRPPESYYEAICAIWFMREVCNALDGLGFAVIAHIDRLLAPYYEADLAAGRLTPEEAQEYMDCFVSMTDARWDLEADLPGGTNADLIIGGCNASGQPVFNDVTRMVIHSFIRYRFANPKLQARVSAAHPQE